jgi:hypothetical protein
MNFRKSAPPFCRFVEVRDWLVVQGVEGEGILPRKISLER